MFSLLYLLLDGTKKPYKDQNTFAYKKKYSEFLKGIFFNTLFVLNALTWIGIQDVRIVMPPREKNPNNKKFVSLQL